MMEDFEDLIFLWENREEIWGEIIACKEPLRSYLKNELDKLVQDPNLMEWIECHIERGGDSKKLFEKLLETTKSL